MSIATELQKIRQSKSAIKAAITEKIKEDAGDNLSTYADKIASIKSGGFDFISESRDYNFTNDNPHPTVNITTQNNEAYFIYP